MTAPVVEVLRRRGPRPVEPPSAPLPTPVTAALAAIVRDMRDVPRDCLRDPAELFIWLRRMAGRVEGVGRMRMAGALPAARPASPRDLAEAVFGTAPTAGKSQAVARRPAVRMVTSRKGRAVPVELRRARTAGQMELL